LFSKVGLSEGQVFRMPAEREDLEAAARAYEALLPDRLDLIVLGIGEDGHTCSLFPGRPQVEESKKRVVAVHDSAKPPPRRLSLTPPVLAEAGQLVTIVAGRAKASAVWQALRSSASAREVPARLAREGAWFLDDAAASELEKGDERG